MSGTCTRLLGLPHVPVQYACCACAKTCPFGLRDCCWVTYDLHQEAV